MEYMELHGFSRISMDSRVSTSSSVELANNVGDLKRHFQYALAGYFCFKYDVVRRYGRIVTRNKGWREVTGAEASCTELMRNLRGILKNRRGIAVLFCHRGEDMRRYSSED